MANPEHLSKLKEGVEAWNHWREINPAIRPDLKGGYLSRAYLSGANLRGANLREANFSEADLSGAFLTGANLNRANLRQASLREAKIRETEIIGANLREANLSGAQLREADIVGGNLNSANLCEANLSGANLRKADIIGANVTGAKLIKADLSQANLNGANLSKADLSQANLTGAKLSKADLSGANLREANFSGAYLGGANLSGADLSRAFLSGALLYKANLRDANLTSAKLSKADLSQADFTGAKLIEADLSQADLTESQLSKADLTQANLIGAITSKLVLILGRFTHERSGILDAIREELRKRDYMLVTFDFEKLADKDDKDAEEMFFGLLETARFVIAGLTEPSSVPQEVTLIAKSRFRPAVPLQPILLEGQGEYALFADLKASYDWMLEPFLYGSKEQLIDQFNERVIAPAEAKAHELKTRFDAKQVKLATVEPDLSPVLEEEVHLGVSTPRDVCPGEEFVARFAAYTEAYRDEVYRVILQEGPSAHLRLDLERCRWRLGAKVTVRLEARSLELSNPVQTFEWNGTWCVLRFDARVSVNATVNKVILRFDVAVQGFPIAAIRPEIAVSDKDKDDKSAPRSSFVEQTAPKSAFASYAEEDRPDVLSRVRSVQIVTGIDVFLDCLSMRPGEEWKETLIREIRKRDIFWLFWSRSAMASQWVGWEWRTALAEKSLSGIQPHPLEPSELAPPPQELSDLQFGAMYEWYLSHLRSLVRNDTSVHPEDLFI